MAGKYSLAEPSFKKELQFPVVPKKS